ncbi:MAG: hypothetical protein ACFB2W_07855 [Leptolyngbyaceae cyanobacterium]
MSTLQRTIKRASRWYIQLWQGLNGKTHQRLRQLQQANGELEQRLFAANSQIETLNRTLTLSQQREVTLNQQLHETTRRYEQLQQKLAAFRQAEANLRTQLADAQQQCKTLQQDLDQSTLERQALAATAEQAADLRSSLIETENKRKTLQKEIDGLTTYTDHEIKTLEDELARQQSAFGKCQVQLGAALATVSRTADENNKATAADDGPLPPLSLAEWKIALIGGHENTVQGVNQKLQQEYQLQTLVEIPSVHMPQQQLKQKLENCDLIVSIVNYSNHALTQSIAQLKSKGALRGEILPVNCRGVSGVVREILSFVQTQRISGN